MAGISSSTQLIVPITLYRQEVLDRYFSTMQLAYDSFQALNTIAATIREYRKLPFFPENIILPLKKQAIAPHQQIVMSIAAANLLLSKIDPQASVENQQVHMQAQVAQGYICKLGIEITLLEKAIQTM